jgi:hypothetical protein
VSKPLPMRAMFTAYWVLIIVMFAAYLYVGLADR